MKFSHDYHALFITEIAQIGKILDHEIFQISKWKVIPIIGVKSDIEEKECKQMRNYLESETNKFYYSFTYDMSHNLQDNFCYSLKSNETIKKKYELAEFPVFKWNDFLSQYFSKAGNGTVDKDKWVIKMIHGYYEEMTIELFSNIISIHLISRRMVQNSGTRYNRRGLNPDGFPANFVETEQIVANLTISSKIKPMISSFVQVRGSVPIYWFQEPGMFTPKPEINIRDVDFRLVGANKHFSDMVGLYGRNIFCLNLMKSRPHRKSNKEEILSEEYRALMERLRNLDRKFENVDYCHIDLKNSIKEDQDNFFNIAFKLAENLTKKQKFFLLSGFEAECLPGDIIIRFQNGVSRVNCVDCLDRTNFMQNILGEMSFSEQLKTCLRLPQDQRLDISQKILQIYQSLWRNTGDNIALQYGGSKAHQQKDSNVAEMMYQSAKRHLANTFSDNQKQYQISVFLGDFIPGADKIWDIKISSTYAPSTKIINRMQEGELFGKPLEDYLKKHLVDGCKIIDDCRMIIAGEHLSLSKVDEPFKQLLFKQKMFENRKNMVAELIEKKIIKGFEKTDIQEEDEERMNEMNRKKKFSEFIPVDKEAEESKVKMAYLLEDLKSNQNNLAFSQFLKMTESLRSKPINYDDLKRMYYKEVSRPIQKNDFLFDQTYKDIIKENLINQYDLFTINEDNSFERCNSEEHPMSHQHFGHSHNKPKNLKQSLGPDDITREVKRSDTSIVGNQSSVLSTDMRQIIQNIPNAVKNKVKVF